MHAVIVKVVKKVNLKKYMAVYFIILLLILFVFNFFDPFISTFFDPQEHLIKLDVTSKEFNLENSSYIFQIINATCKIPFNSKHDFKALASVEFIDINLQKIFDYQSEELDTFTYISNGYLIIPNATIIGINSNLSFIKSGKEIKLHNPDSIIFNIQYDIYKNQYPLKFYGLVNIESLKYGRKWIWSLTSENFESGTLFEIYKIDSGNETLVINFEKLNGNINSGIVNLYQTEGSALIRTNNTFNGHDSLSINIIDLNTKINTNLLEDGSYKIHSESFQAKTRINNIPTPKNRIHTLISLPVFQIPYLLSSLITSSISGIFIRYIFERRDRQNKDCARL